MNILLRKIWTLITNPKGVISNIYESCHRKLINFCVSKRIYPLLTDKLALKIKWKWLFGYKLNLKNPQTFNEKLQWLKLYDRNPLYPTLVDKALVKDYVAKIVGSEYIIPTLGIYDTVAEIDFEKLPDQFVLKCTHDSGSVVICKSKEGFDFEAARKKLDKCLHRSQFAYGREWPYKHVKPRIIAEQYLVDESGCELKDYKIFCFNGNPEYVEVDFNRQIKHKLNTYDFDWNPLNFCDASKNDYSVSIKKPERLDDMRKVAEKLSKNIKFLRVDFYSVFDKFYVGELTLYPGSGFISFEPKSVDLKLGKLLRLEDD